MTTFNTPEDDQVLQEDDIVPQSIPVHVTNILRTDEQPTVTAYKNIILRGSSSAEKILNADARRKKVSLFWIASADFVTEAICVGSTFGEAHYFSGAMLTSPNATSRYEITDKGEIWARSVIIQGASTAITGFTVSTSDCVISLIVEMWAN